MADLKRWFKVWTSILEDPSHTNLSLEDAGRWVRLGAMMALVGEGGRLLVARPATRLCQVLEVGTIENAFKVLKRLPNVCVEEGQSDNDVSVVIMKNWSKYQIDSTVYERVKRLRSKRRGDESRGDKKRSVGRDVLSDVQFIEFLKASPAYQGIDIDRELGKMDVYLQTPKGKGRQKTRQYIVRWLNRIDRPMVARGADDEDAE